MNDKAIIPMSDTRATEYVNAHHRMLRACGEVERLQRRLANEIEEMKKAREELDKVFHKVMADYNGETIRDNEGSK